MIESVSRRVFLLAFTLSLITFATFSDSRMAAQSISTPTPTTINAPIPTLGSNEPVELTTHEAVSLATGGVSFFLPVVSLPQRNGQALSLGFVLDGNTYSMREPNNAFESLPRAQNDLAPTQTIIQNAPSLNTMLWSQVIHTNIPTLSADLSFAGIDTWNGCDPPEGNGCPPYNADWRSMPEYCMQNWVFTDWDGSRHSFNGTRDCSQVTMLNANSGADGYWAFSETLPLKTTTSFSSDNAFYVLDATNKADIKIIKRDGTVYHFNGYPSTGYVAQWPNTNGSTDSTFLNRYSAFFSTIVDVNNNTMSYSGGILTDTMNRSINLSTNSLSYKAMNGASVSQASATAVKQTATSTAAWPITYPATTVPGYNGACHVNYVAPSGQGISPPQLIYNGPEGSSNNPAPITYMLTLPNGSIYSLIFDVTGNLIKIIYPSGGYTRYDYQYGRILQTQSFSDVSCAVPTDELLAKHECFLANGACTAAPTSTTINSCTAGAPSGGEATTCYTGLLGLLPAGTNSNGGTSVTITDPLGNVTFQGNVGNQSYSVGAGANGTPLSYYIGYMDAAKTIYSGSSTPLQSVTKTYTGTNCSSGGVFNTNPCSVTTQIYAGANSYISSTTNYQYDTSLPFNVVNIQDLE